MRVAEPGLVGEGDEGLAACLPRLGHAHRGSAEDAGPAVREHSSHVIDDCPQQDSIDETHMKEKLVLQGDQGN